MELYDADVNYEKNTTRCKRRNYEAYLGKLSDRECIGLLGDACASTLRTMADKGVIKYYESTDKWSSNSLREVLTDLVIGEDKENI